MALPGDVVRALAAYPEAARRELDKLDGAVPELTRVARCVMFLAGGDPAKLAQFAAAALLDYRDVIWWAEYDGGETKLRSFMQPLDAVE
jgi:hypothetical protein